MPTACEIIKIKPPKNIDGISYLSALLGNQNKQIKHNFLYWEFPQYGGQQAVRLGKWKGIRMNILKGNMKIQLYDLDNDIQEQHDVAESHPEIVKQIEKIMKKEHNTPDVASFKMEPLEKE